jgi:hypothetical protein
MKSYFCADIKCPFYKGDDGHSMVVCEGVDKAICLKLSFHLTERREEPWNEKEEFKKYVYSKCAGNYFNCALYKMIMAENYPEEANK